MSATRIKMTRTFFLFIALLLIGGCTTPSGDPVAGKKWFIMNNCGSCHGPNGDDGRAVPIAGLNMDFSRFLRKLRTTDAPIMPPFPESKISDQDAADIYAYLQSLKSH